MSRNTDRTATKSVARKARRVPRYRQAIIRAAYRELGLTAQVPRKVAEAIQEDSKAPEGIGKTTN
jgi:transcription termination factor NusB